MNMVVLEIDIVMSSSLFMLITYYSVMTDMIISVTPLWYHFIPFFGDHYDIIFYSYQ